MLEAMCNGLMKTTKSYRAEEGERGDGREPPQARNGRGMRSRAEFLKPRPPDGVKRRRGALAELSRRRKGCECDGVGSRREETSRGQGAKRPVVIQKLHIDDGCLGGGGENGNFVKKREGIFSWCTLMDEELEPNAPYYTPYSRHISIMDFGFEMQANMESPNTIMNCLISNIVLHSVCEEDGDGDGLNILGEMVYGTSDEDSPDSDGDGLPDGLEVQLVKNPDNPNDVYGFDLIISFEDSKDDTFEINEETFDVEDVIVSLEKAMKTVSNILLDATDGYFYIKSISVYDQKVKWEDANIRVSSTCNIEPDHQHTHHDPKSYEPKYVHLLYSAEMIMDFPGHVDCTNVGFTHTICHELGHYRFWFGEEYADSDRKRYEDYEMPQDDYLKLYMNTLMSKDQTYPPQAEFSTFQNYYREGGWIDTRDSLAAEYGTIKDTHQLDINDGESCWETMFRICNGEYVDFDLDHDGVVDTDYYNNYEANIGPTDFDIGALMVINSVWKGDN